MSKKLLIAFMFLFSVTANAGLVIEPLVGYGLSGTFTDKNVTPNTEKEFSGVEFGGRLGYSFLGAMAGVHYSMGTKTFDSSGTGSEVDYDISNLGVFVGYQAPILIKAWATYYLDHKAEATINNSAYETSGSAIAFGAGYTGLPFVSLNVEYRMVTYDEEVSGGTTTALTTKNEATEIFIWGVGRCCTITSSAS